jgi:hypothetical protein
VLADLLLRRAREEVLNEAGREAPGTTPAEPPAPTQRKRPRKRGGPRNA